MRLLIGAMAATISVALAVTALAQSATAPAPAAVAPAPANTAAPAEPVPSGKRFACQTAAQGFKGQERQDQMQLCIAQAHIDCLKQAIDQKIVGPQRRDFVRSCAE
jgi:curli biogenesis system outer membrane secretion channel CsgG